MQINRVVTGSVVILATAVLSAACGAGSGSAAPSLTLKKEYPAIKAAAQAATSVRVAGNVVQNGKPVGLNLALVKPSSASGSVSEGSTSYTIVVTPAQSYIQINKLFLQASHVSGTLCSRVCGKYLAISAASAASFSGLTMTSLINSVFDKPLSKQEAAIKLTAGEYQGQPALTGSSGGETFYVAKGATPYLLSVSKHGQSVTFSQWNSATVSPPPASQVLTVAQFGAIAAGG